MVPVVCLENVIAVDKLGTEFSMFEHKTYAFPQMCTVKTYSPYTYEDLSFQQ